MNDTYILTKIEEKPGAFFKKLGPYWFYQLTYSTTFKEWAEEGEQWKVEDIKAAAKDKPVIAGEIANIVNCLEEKYPDEKYDYKNFTYVSLAIKLHKKYKERILKYYRKNHPVYQGSLAYHPAQNDAWRELVARGFVPEFFGMHDKTKYYLKAIIGTLVLVGLKAQTTMEAQQEQNDWGVMGYTGYNEPK